MESPSYLVITPARDEARHLPDLIDSMTAQTIRPAAWVIVNDGSSDRTGEIAAAAAREHDWIKVVHRNDRGRREAGSGVMDAFYDGLSEAGEPAWEFLVKLDGDLWFAPHYFEECFAKFAADEGLGIGGGMVSLLADGQTVPDSAIDPPFHVRGATKIYRRECWKQIGALIREPGWDTVDEVRANMLGWTTRTFPDVVLIHQRPTGQAYGRWHDFVKGGRANYIAGYRPIFMAAKCVRRLFHPPYFSGGLALAWGYLGCWLRRKPRVADRSMIRYFQQQQLNRLLFRKSLWG